MIERMVDEGKTWAAVVIVITGFWGVVITFSDYPTTWSSAAWFAYVAGSHVPSGFLVAFLIAERWYLSLLVGWGAVGTLLLVASDLVIPLLAVILCAGYLGRLVAKWYSARKPASHN